MFINFWYPAGKSEDLTDKPKHMQMLGMDIVLFRDSRGTAHALSNVCVHRGGFLANGKIKGDNVECPYHGWQFNGGGQCTRIPSLGADAKVPSRAKIDAYPTEERYGLVHVFLGDLPDEERPPIMEIPEWGQPGWRATIQEWNFAYDYKRSVENGLDSAHNEFVHPTHGFAGGRDDYKLPPRETLKRDWGFGIWGERLAPALPDRKMREASGRAETGIIEAGTGHHAVNCLWTYIHPSPTLSIHQYGFKTPIDESHTRSWLVNLRNFMIEPEHDARMMERNQYVAFQDRDVLEHMQPITGSLTNRHETFVGGDEPIALYRNFLKDWEGRGWRIDTERLFATRGRTAYAIPSPARRETKGWTVDPVPLVAASQAARAAAE